MYDTVFRNASGLPNPEQMTSARDLATLARHLIVDYGEYYHYFAVPGFYFHGHTVPNHDPMLGAYPGADGSRRVIPMRPGIIWSPRPCGIMSG